ncbi:YggT family protein [Phenylobacterium sp.]|uniref:YggT family protein n=1 Tax=Phenylobacterium sp. TaxID=1871053 RepID=UPI002DE7C8B1|nr:YggT family protein [Phenylobacterium sp.]
MASFIYYILDAILGLIIWAIIINAIISWLVAFDVINLRNRIVYSIAHFLDAVTRPILRPFQRFIPPLGGVDVTPILAMLVIQGIRIYLLPMAMAPLQRVLG